jgi:hypothetical protein
VTEIPKPAKRARKPRKPIKARGRKRTPTRRKQRKALAKLCNELWSRWIRRGARCEFIGQRFGQATYTEPHVCRGPLQAMHGFGKKAYPSVRYAPWNGFCGCAAAHSYFTWRAPEWENYLRGRWGAAYHDRLAEAMLAKKRSLEEVIGVLKALPFTREKS